jgi:hypothetical protein
MRDRSFSLVTSRLITRTVHTFLSGTKKDQQTSARLIAAQAFADLDRTNLSIFRRFTNVVD